MRLSHCDTQVRPYNSFLKHGVEKHIFEIITECEIENLNDLERYYQDLFKATDKNTGLNCMLTKSSTRSGKSSQETIYKIAISSRRPRKPRSEETKQKLRLANLGKKHTKETIAKMVSTRTGNKYRLGKKLSDFERIKMSERRKGISTYKGWKPSREQVNRNIDIMADKRGIIVLNTETGIFYNQIKEAAFTINIDASYFSKVLKGKHKNKTNFILTEKAM